VRKYADWQRGCWVWDAENEVTESEVVEKEVAESEKNVKKRRYCLKTAIFRLSVFRITSYARVFGGGSSSRHFCPVSPQVRAERFCRYLDPL
jgi:hypothetical protein